MTGEVRWTINGTRYGADVDELRRLGKELERAAQELASTRDVVGSVVARAGWWGLAGERFRTAWTSTHAPGLTVAAADLTRAADAAQQNAADQEKTSSADAGDRRDQGRDAGSERRGRGDDPSDPDTDHSTSGPQPYRGGLGDPVPGEDAPDEPPPEWSPPDGGAGEHGSEDAGFLDRRLEEVVEGAAHAASAAWPDASRHLLHYLDNSGEDLEVPVDTLLADLPELDDEVTARQTRLGADAIARAKASGADGPVTFPVNTGWNGYYAHGGQSKNWFYATGGFAYNLNGEVTVYPPDTPGGEWRYESDTAVNFRDRYNWDHDKSTQIGPITVTDDQLAELHRKGLAQEYNLVGTSSTRHAEGRG